MGEKSIEAEGLTKIYNGFKAVDSIDLDVDEGEVCGFIGPNGSGKTTTISMLTGLIAPTMGKCLIKGIDVIKYPVDAKKILGYLPENVGFYSNFTAVQNLKYFSEFYNLEKADTHIKELLDRVGLLNNDKPVGHYSKGMKQRLGLARALLNDPEVIFLDEPTSGLDPKGIALFKKIIREQSANGKTVLFSSHILSDVQDMCSSICLIYKGRSIARGNIEDVKKRYAHTYSIISRISDKMPELKNPEIIDVSCAGKEVIIKAKSDVRDYVSRCMLENNVKIIEMRLVEHSLEDIFLEIIREDK